MKRCKHCHVAIEANWLGTWEHSRTGSVYCRLSIAEPEKDYPDGPIPERGHRLELAYTG